VSFEQIQDRERGLSQKLTSQQMSMIAIGGAIGTGLFLGSKFAIGFAGPSVILSYAIGGLIGLLLMGCLAEMAVAHPTSGSFGAYAEWYIDPLAGFLVRYAYWSCIVLAIGTEVTAVGEYMGFWFPAVPPWVWMAAFSGVLIGVNAMSVNMFGSVEYVFSSIKVFSIIGFVIAGAYILVGRQNPAFGPQNLHMGDGFFPHGLWGMWVAVVVSIFSYLSIEMIAVAAGEAQNPEQAVKRAFKATIFRLVLFYLGSLSIILMIVPWNRINEGGSPFVTVMQVLKIPYAAGILNFVVVVAALSAMNSQIYITTRMMFSLSRAGDAPKILGRLSAQGVPIFSLSLSTLGVALATVLALLFPKQAFLLMVSISMFGAMFTWMMIFVTHLFFRRERRRTESAELPFQLWFFPFSTLLGLSLIVAVLVTTWFTTDFHLTLIFGLPYLAILVGMFALIRRARRGGEQN
jgi:L-asparagine transporter-like permease